MGGKSIKREASKHTLLKAPSSPSAQGSLPPVSRGNPPHVWQTPSLISPPLETLDKHTTPTVSLVIGSVMRFALTSPFLNKPFDYHKILLCWEL